MAKSNPTPPVVANDEYLFSSFTSVSKEGLCLAIIEQGQKVQQSQNTDWDESSDEWTLKFLDKCALRGLKKMLRDLECSEDGCLRFDYYRAENGYEYEVNYMAQLYSPDIRSLLFPESVFVKIKPCVG